MKKNILVAEIINGVLDAEKHAIERLLEMDKDSVSKAISLISDSNGKIIVSGIGKSAFVAQKFVATLNSTGTTSVFVHAADAMHGDVGIIDNDDVVVFISKSGGSKEVLELLTFVNSIGVSSVSITNNVDSVLHQKSTVSILLPHIKEAGTDNLIPTASIISHLAICDCISIALMQINEFTAKDFGRLHPRGTLGKQLTTVGAIASNNAKPSVLGTDSLQHIIYTISSNKLGACCVVDAKGKVIGIITDGDIRRMLEKGGELSKIKAEDIYTKNPIMIDVKAISKDGLDLMAQENINQLIVVDSENVYKGIVHLQNLITE